MTKSGRPNFNLIMKVNRTATQTWVWGSGASLVLALALAKYSSLNSTNFVVKVFGFFLFLVIFIVGAIILSYVARLHYSPDRRLEINENGLFDFASFCSLGYVPMSAIANIRFAQLWGWEFLVIDFFSNLNPVAESRGLSAEIYRLLFGLELWVPVDLFRVSRIDLESQLIHLDHLIGRGRQSSKPSAGDPPPKRTTGSSPLLGSSELSSDPSANPLTVVSGWRPEVDLPPPPPSLAGRAAVMEAQPPPLSQVRPEKARIMEKIDAIKQEVKSRGFDSRVAMLYLDHVAMFPALATNSPQSLPSGLSGVHGSQEGTDYEEVSFHFRQHRLSFGLRREIAANNEALLSVGVNGKVQMSLKVRVEIGELAPLDLESFIPGPWQQLIDDLWQEIHRMEAERLGRIQNTSPATPRLSELRTETKTNLEDLKNRFGIKE